MVFARLGFGLILHPKKQSHRLPAAAFFCGVFLVKTK